MSTPSPIRELIDKVRREMSSSKLAMDLCAMAESLDRAGDSHLRCPFEDPKFGLPAKEKCPVCGMLGTIDAENKCVG